ncbi:MAG: thiol:disulfide interchange protein DsbA/DsbL [Luminiphilus sp.]|jgi:thiol:disulfide interchange protein DsbA|nr:thiol:disulfide interchange protein DsbA/DsbL [Luminiphilus sp.]MDG2036731.1 thiol:disulfide interchange protein DsbA/DsbL [Luminiphilus sp.]RZO80454.1 MAG: thiol:disulfide interchange protein DsbA/DsbL [Halieaceae bacterium]|tara:strand:- start:807 stop:1460 length:654 start_codon:yes stop_codon:yes gene_type:complete
MTGTRKRIATLSLTLVAYAAAALSTLAVAEERWVEGQHYQTLTPPVAVGRGSDVMVTEFFWYGCGHCYTFEPMLTAWGKQLPEEVVLQPSPAVWNDPMRMHAKAYYIAEVLGVKETLHPVIFDAMHVQRKRLVSRLELRDLFEDNGVDPAQFDKAFDSFGVDSQVRQADARARSAKISGTPSLMVAGKYLIETRAAGSQTNMLEIARYLIDKELAAR